MRRTFTLAPSFFRYLQFLLLSWGLLLFGSVASQAQALPASEGLVADSTELRVLRQFYYATQGNQWTTRTNWLQGATLTEAATWAGVGVSGGDVTSLWLPENQLVGPLPVGLGQLRALQYLVLDHNQLSGSLPNSLADCASLTYVRLGVNQLTGHLPTAWGKLSHLTHLWLAGNRFSGPLPAEFTQLHELVTLGLDYNQLSGPLPARWEGLIALSGLSLNNNLLTGELPASLGQLPVLAYCQLQSNQFTGPLPTPAGQGWRRLLYLDANRNQLEGVLPDSLGNCQALTYLDLSDNHFSGPLPTTLGQLTSLEQLHAPRNAFAGPLPASLGQLPHLWFVNLTDNQLTGMLPNAWGQLRSLRQLYLSNNKLQGPLPDSLGQLAELGYLTLNHNQLTGPLPAAWQGLRGLQQLHVEDNQLSGPLPEALPVVELYLDRNRFGGTVPASYATSPTLRTLSLNENEFTQLPNFNVSPNLAQLRLSISDNWLEFDAYERNQPTADAGRWYYWNYSRTQRQPPAVTKQVVNGGAAQLSGRLGGAYNHYQWQRQVAGQWVEIPGQTTPELSWAAVTTAESGTYRTRVTSDWVGGITLYSRPLVLDVVPYRPLAQNRPDDTNKGLATPLAAPLRLAADTARTGDINFVRSWSPRVALTDSSRVRRAPVDSVAASTQYLDGLGRPIQTVLHQASAGRRDMVQPQAYDGLGREPRQYLPYAAAPVTTRQGYHADALAAQYAFYQRTGPVGGIGPLPASDPTVGVARTGAAYAETQFEASPLNRVTAQGAPGEAWQLTAGHIVERQERPNTAQDSVLRFVPGYDPRSRDPGYQGFYAPGELWGTDVADSHGPNEPGAQGYRTLEWKDKLGQVVLKQVEANRTGTTQTGLRSRWLRTAYAYDDFGHLRYVLQPEASRRVLALGDQAAVLPASALPFLFHYRFDGRGRQIAKQVPGQEDETLVVYDQLDRPVLSQDAAQRPRREWSWTKYDALGRIILAGLVTRGDTLGQVSLQALATADTATAHQYEQRTADKATYPHFLTTDQSFPKLGQQGFGAGQVLSITHYDDYDFDNDGPPDATYNASTDSRFPSGQAPVADALRTTGLTTRTKTRVLGVAEDDPNQGAWLTTTTFYDERARPVQVQTINARLGLDLLTTQLDFTGKVVQSVAVHQGPSHDPVQVAEFFTYDHTGRLLTTRQQLPDEARPALLDSVSYNEIGQAVRKTLGTGRLRQEVDYAYNIRGWLTSLNDPYQPNKQDLFNLSLHYERGFTPGYEQYNGNLTGQTWRGRDGVQRAYGYVYDPLNRLLQGDFVARTTTTPATPSAGLWKAEEDNYRLSFVSYDDNGNILTLRRRGLLQNATHARSKQYGAVDNLTYAYQGNRLLAVDDAITGNQLPQPKSYHGAPTSLAGDFQEAGVKLGEEYLYDANGNLTQDKNKGITGIVYNHLNLPRQIHFGAVGDSIVFRYTAAGQKVAKLVYQTGKATPLRTDYLGPYQYEQDSLKFFPHAEGRVLRFVAYDAARQTRVSYQREFTFKDHLGNLRLAYRAGQTRTYLASLEQDEPTRKRETQQFDSLSVSPPIAVATPYALGQYAARLTAGGASPQPLGPLTQLTVQKGDSLRVSVSGLYPQKVNNPSFAFSLASFVASLVQPASSPSGVDGSRRGGLPLLQLGLGAGVAALPQLRDGVPKGYLRVLVFNQDSALIDQRTLQLTKAALGNYEVLHDTLTIRRDGYVSVYVGNESAADVYFDELRIEHRQGLQVQETQYDPAGLELAGLARPSPSIQGLNNYRFNGKEFQMDLGLAWNHQDWRFFDPQLLRWHSVDKLTEKSQENWSPYQFGFDNAVRYNDPDGQEVIVEDKKQRKEVAKWINSRADSKFAFNRKGELYQKRVGNGKTGSAYYSERLNTAIASDGKIKIDISKIITYGKGKGAFVIDVDAPGIGGGTTRKIVGTKNALVTISGTQHQTDGENGKFIPSTPSDLLVHELVGHAIPYLSGKDTGNAIENENKVRRQQPAPNNQLRKSDPYHAE